MSAEAAASVQKSDKFPPGIPYIIGNEAAERFSYYGMRAILKIHIALLVLGVSFADIRGRKPEDVKKEYPAAQLKEAEAEATEVYHLFMAGVYAFPMIGAIMADRLLGKYKVIFWVSILYCVGHAVLAVAPDHKMGMYLGLAIIALASGGIKPCVSANVGDQFTQANSHLVSKIYQIFYFSINFGSFFATLSIPLLYKYYGPDVAFGVPGIAMLLATIVFWIGRNKFIRVPPKPGGKIGFIDFIGSVLLFLPFMLFAFFKEYIPTMFWYFTGISIASIVGWYFLFTYRQSLALDRGFLAISFYAMKNQHLRQPGQGFFDVARDKYGEDAEGPVAVLKIILVFSMVSVFWGLFDQHGSTWIEQAGLMNRTFSVMGTEVHLESSQTGMVNPLLVMILIPVVNLCLFGPLEKRGIVVKPLMKMTIGMFLTALSFVAVALVQHAIDSAAQNGEKVSWLWQIIPYAIMTAGEILVSTVGLEFAYTQAPRAMKSTIMGFWLLCVTIGNLLVAFLAYLQKEGLAQFFWIFAILMAIASIIFAVLAYFYKGKTYLQDAQPGH